MPYVGSPVLRREDERILAGRSRFLADLDAPDGLLHAAFVRSPHAHARLRAVRGEGAILTAADLAGTAPARIDAPPGLEIADEPHPLLAYGDVRYIGQPVALVVAASRALAEDLAERVEVDYEPLDPVLDPRAVDPLVRWEKRAGDVAGAFAAAAHVVRSDRVIPRVNASPLEPRGVLVAPGDVLTMWSSSQSAHRHRAQLAQTLGRSEASIRVIVPEVGGGFGSKGALPVEAPVVALAALRLGRPLSWVEDRRENALAAPQGRGVRGALELALDGEGRILALRARVLADLGAYLLAGTAIPPHTLAMLLTGAYDIPAVEVVVTGARTNRVPTAPYRGGGAAEASYLIETAIDAAARELGLDPVLLRRRNLVRAFPHRTALGWTYDSGDYERCLDMALELARPEPGDSVGLALTVSRSGGLHEYAEVAVEGGRFVVRAGSTPSGEGLETVFAQIAADRLGVELDRVDVRFGDTSELADGVGSFASRSTAMGGAAVALAAEDLLARGLVGSARFESAQAFPSGACVAVVRVERATGRVHVRRLVLVEDAGTIVNPLLAEGQLVGGAVAGLGAMLEPGWPTSAGAPPVEVAFVESPSPLNPLGAKGISERGAIGAPPALANALAAALGMHVDPPFSPETLWGVLR